MQSAGGFQLGSGRIGFATAMNMQVGTSEAMNVSTTLSTTLALGRLATAKPISSAPRGGVVDGFALIDADTSIPHTWSAAAAGTTAAMTSSVTFKSAPDAVFFGTHRIIADRSGRHVRTGDVVTETNVIVPATTIAERFALAPGSLVTNGGGIVARVARHPLDNTLLCPIEHTKRRCSTALTPPRAMHIAVPRPGAGSALLSELVVCPRASLTYLDTYRVDGTRACVDAQALASALGVTVDDVPPAFECVFDDDPVPTNVRVRMPRTGACTVGPGGVIDRAVFRALADEWGGGSGRRWTGPVSTRLSTEADWTTGHGGGLICLPLCDRAVSYTLVAVPDSPSCAAALGLAAGVCVALGRAGVATSTVSPGVVTPDMPEIAGELAILGDLRETASMFELRRMVGLTGTEPQVVHRFDIPAMLRSVCPALQRLAGTPSPRHSDIARARAELPLAMRLSVPNDQPESRYETRFAMPRSTHTVLAASKTTETGSMVLHDVSCTAAYTVRFGAAQARIDPSTGSIALEMVGGLRAVRTTSAFERADIVMASTGSRTHVHVRVTLPTAAAGIQIQLALDAPNVFATAPSSIGAITSDDATTLVSILGPVRVRGYARETAYSTELTMAAGEERTVELPVGFALADTAHVARAQVLTGAAVAMTTGGAATTIATEAVEWIVSQSTIRLHNPGVGTVSIRLRVTPCTGIVRAPCIPSATPFALRLPAFIEAPGAAAPRGAIRPVSDVVASGSYGISLDTVRTHFTVLARGEGGAEHVIIDATPISPGAVVEFEVDVHSLRNVLLPGVTTHSVSIAHRFDTDPTVRCDANVSVRTSPSTMMRVMDTAGRGYVHVIDRGTVRISVSESEAPGGSA
jgi:hypothetical protein